MKLLAILLGLLLIIGCGPKPEPIESFEPMAFDMRYAQFESYNNGDYKHVTASSQLMDFLERHPNVSIKYKKGDFDLIQIYYTEE